MKRSFITIATLALAVLVGPARVEAQRRATLGGPIETTGADLRAAETTVKPAARVATQRPQTVGTTVQPDAQKSPPAPVNTPVERVIWDQPQSPGEFVSARASYLLWWTRGQSFPALLTTSPSGTPQASAGVLGAAGTQAVIGAERIDDGVRSGGRFGLIFWRDPAQSIGLETDFLFRAASTASSHAASTGDPILARPFLNALTGRQDAVLTAYPGLVTGALNIVANTGTLYGGELNLRSNVMRSENSRLDLLAGYRIFGISDRVTITDIEIDAQTRDRVDVADRFRSESQFHGGQVGVVAEWRRDRYYVDVTGKIALGGTSSSVDIEGASSFNGAAPVPGGVLAVQSNIGHYRGSRFAVLPEIGVNAGYRVGPALRVFAGYTFVYLSDVTRAAEQINLTINPNQLPPAVPGGPAQPAFPFHHTSFWAHGVQFGMELRY